MSHKADVEIVLLRVAYVPILQAVRAMSGDGSQTQRVIDAVDALLLLKDTDFPDSVRSLYSEALAKKDDPAAFALALHAVTAGLFAVFTEFADSVNGDVGLTELCADSAATAAKSGFVGQSLPEFVALVHSELSEALEEHRDHRRPDETWYSLKSARMEAAAREELGLGPDDPLPRGVNCSIPVKKGTPGAKPEGIPSEIADVVIRCCHYAGANRIDLAAVVLEKATFNRTRPRLHGGRKI